MQITSDFHDNASPAQHQLLEQLTTDKLRVEQAELHDPGFGREGELGMLQRDSQSGMATRSSASCSEPNA